MNRFDNISIGDEASITRIVTDEDIARFVQLSGDDNKLHLDKEFAKHTPLEKPVAHGMIANSLISTLIGTRIPGDGALWFSQVIDYLAPFRVGDTLTAKVKVSKKMAAEQVIELLTDVFNQHRQKIATGSCKVKVLESKISNQVDANELQEVKPISALVLGGSGGIGSEVCRVLASFGYTVFLQYNSNEGKAYKICEEISEKQGKCYPVHMDFSQDSWKENLVHSISRKGEPVSIIVNCLTSRLPQIKFSDLFWNDFEQQMKINLKSIFDITKMFLPTMEENRFGRIINITSLFTDSPKSGFSHYISAKCALEGFTKSLALEYAAKGITFNLVSPGVTDTELISDIPQKMRAMMEATIPVKSFAKAKDVANAVGFLAKPESRYITGTVMRVNGGQFMI